MAGMDTQKEFLSLIRDFASEKSQGDRRVASLKKQIDELRSAVDIANAELENAKRSREAAEQELKGIEVERALNESTIQTLEARVSSIQDEISTVKCDVEDLKINFDEFWNCGKEKEGSSRDEFIGKMFEMNTKIRNFMHTVRSDINEGDHIGKSANFEEEMLLAEQDTANKVQEEFIALEKKVLLMEAITKETTTLSELTKQSSELEQKSAQLFDKLQRQCICPNCRKDNVETLGDILQT